MPASRPTTRPRRDAQRILATVIWASLILVATVLLSRRLAGGFSADGGSVVGACLAGSVAMILSLAAHLIYYAGKNAGTQRTAHFLTGVVSLVPPCAVAITVFPFGSTVGVMYLATLFLLAATALILTGESTPLQGGPSRQRATRRRGSTLPGGPPAASPPEWRLLPAAADSDDRLGENIDGRPRDKRPFRPSKHPLAGARHQLSNALQSTASDQTCSQQTAQSETGANDDQPPLQWMTRSTTPDGSDRVEGSVHVHFASGQRQAVIHLPFVPPLAEAPHVDCEVLDDGSARLRVTDARPYGARIEVKRGQPIRDAATIEVGFVAVASCRHRHAA